MRMQPLPGREEVVVTVQGSHAGKGRALKVGKSKHKVYVPADIHTCKRNYTPSLCIPQQNHHTIFQRSLRNFAACLTPVCLD
jgi:hypothetical protein